MRVTTIPVRIVAITPVVYAEKNSWIYNAGYLQGVLGAGLKGHPTIEFLQGYTKGTEQYWLGEKDQGPMPTGDQGTPMSYRRQTPDGLKDLGYSTCPPGHTAEYCTGYLFGYWWASDVLG